MSTLRLEEWVGTCPAKRRSESLQAEEGHVPRLGGQRGLDEPSATWLTLRVSRKLWGRLGRRAGSGKSRSKV